MNQFLTLIAASAIAIILWSRGKKIPTGIFLQSIRKSDGFIAHDQVEEVNFIHSKRIQENNNQRKQDAQTEIPKTIQEKVKLRKRIESLIKGGPEERLKAVVLSEGWGNRQILHILRRGLKDSDSRVIIASARSINKFKGFRSQKSLTRRPPRNVALMR